jgi:N-acetylglucosaminyl-diphospho-decaprenol L-rhamnosyltransferase
VRQKAPGLSDVTVVVVVSLEPAEVVEKCLGALQSSGLRIVVVDNASASGDDDKIAASFPAVTLVRLDDNRGYGGAANIGIERADRDDILLLNADAWPASDGLERLLDCAAARPRAGMLAPKLIGSDGTAQVSQFAFPTRWWSGRPAVSSWPERGRGELLGSAAPAPARRGVVVGAAIFLRRAALDAVGAFDPRFFLFSEEVDLAWRMWEGGWSVEVCPGATFVHLGGSATRRNWPAMYREQVRGHLRMLEKHRGYAVAEGARRYLVWALRLRALTARGEEARAFRDTARWLGEADTETLLTTDP